MHTQTHQDSSKTLRVLLHHRARLDVYIGMLAQSGLRVGLLVSAGALHGSILYELDTCNRARDRTQAALTCPLGYPTCLAGTYPPNIATEMTRSLLGPMSRPGAGESGQVAHFQPARARLLGCGGLSEPQRGLCSRRPTLVDRQRELRGLMS